MTDEFSPHFRQFIDQNIQSVAQLEALILLRRESQRDWNAEEIGRALYIPPDLAATLLADFGRRGLAKVVVQPNVRYTYQIADAGVDQLISEIASAYQDRRVALISLIYSKPLNKVQTFADAFRLRKETPP
jgi:hypothetical protein